MKKTQLACSIESVLGGTLTTNILGIELEPITRKVILYTIYQGPDYIYIRRQGDRYAREEVIFVDRSALPNPGAEISRHFADQLENGSGLIGVNKPATGLVLSDPIFDSAQTAH